MLVRLIILYSNIFTLNFGIKLSHGAIVNKNIKSIAHNITMVNRGYSSMSEADDTWQPIIETNNWLTTKPTTFTPALSLSTSSVLWRNSNLIKNLSKTAKQKYRENTNPQTYHNFKYNAHHYSRNYNKQHIKTLTSNVSQSSKSTSSSPLQSIKYINLKSHIYSKNIKDNNGTKNLNNDIESLYSQKQIPKYIKSQEKEHQKPLLYYANNKNYSISHHLADLEKRKKVTNSSSSLLTYWHYSPKSSLQATKDIIMTPLNDTSKTLYSYITNLHGKATSENEAGKKIDIVRNSTDTIFTKNVTDFISNEELIHNEIRNVKKPQPETNYITSLHHCGAKSHNADDGSTDVAIVAATDDEDNLNAEILLRKALAHVEKFYIKLKNIIMSERNNYSASINSNDDYDYDEDNDYDMYSNDDLISDGNDLQILNSSSHQLIKDTSTLVSAAIATTLDKIKTFNMQNKLLSLSSTGEVKGRKRQIDKDDMKYSLINLPSSVALLRSSLRSNVNKTAKEPIQSTIINRRQMKDHLQNLLSKDSTEAAVPPTPSSSSKTHTSSLLTQQTSKSLKMVSSGRKVKKVKKKFKKFLLPLVLAYKLKFMTLMPLLIGGLILLVGSTGLAGFFFALFTAVMSLKTGSRSAIIVKKY